MMPHYSLVYAQQGIFTILQLSLVPALLEELRLLQGIAIAQHLDRPDMTMLTLCARVIQDCM